ncbi:MAG: c-type cytochrome [bacterium]|nr:c-type cytochrome [bacterium]
MANRIPLTSKRSKDRRRSWIGLAGLAALLGVAVVAWSQSSESLATGEIVASLEPERTLAASRSLLSRGQAVYEKHCKACHGVAGDGDGEATYLLYPKPRDFTRGQYRLVSSWETVPTDQDLFETISRGMPGSAMPSWGHLSEKDRWGLVHYIKSFSRRPFEIPEAEEPIKQYGTGKGVIQVPAPPADTPEGEARARELYVQGCAACHGVTGRGDGRQEQIDSEGRPTRPRDLTAGVFKGVPEPEDVYRRIVAGLPGSPMPSNPYLHGDDGWHLTRLVLSMSSPEQREQVEMKRYRMLANRVTELPTHPDAGAWRAVEPVALHLMPLWWRGNRPEELTVKAVHDGEELAILLVWSDTTWDHTVMRPQDFRDAAAVQFALTPDPPFFAMGELGSKVNIWMWKSERQADLQPAYQDLEKVYPNLGIDSYPNFLRSPLEQPARHALTLESDPTYVTGWGAGNVVSDPTGKSSVEDLSAEGFGTLRARPSIDRKVSSTGVYGTGSYRVLFRRSLPSDGPDAASLRPGRKLAVAFAVWDGSAGDRDGKKSVTIWQELVLAR